jgi:hypothetical protein
MNRLKQDQEEEGKQPPRAGDYFTVETRYATYYVSPDTARRIGAALERFWRPRWVKFVDLNGGRVWLKTTGVEAVVESNEAQRSRDRAFHHAQRKEEKADRRWDDDENW